MDSRVAVGGVEDLEISLVIREAKSMVGGSG